MSALEAGASQEIPWRVAPALDGAGGAFCKATAGWNRDLGARPWLELCCSES